VVIFELTAYPDPKSLSKIDLEPLLLSLGTIAEVARATGLGWSAVQERLQPRRRWSPKLKRFVPL
jgi:hypothetical protein